MSSAEEAAPADPVGKQVGEDFELHLGKVLKGVSSPICARGRTDLGCVPSVTLRGGSGETFAIQPPHLGAMSYSWEEKDKKLARQVEMLKGLTAKIPQAPFGLGSKTVYDSSVRDARQLKAEDFDLNISDDVIASILGEVKKGLCLKTDVIAEPYSLNVYEKGGKFARHKDTPRGEDMVGTLLLLLPSIFAGGGFELSLGNEKAKCFSYGSDSNGGLNDWWTNEEEKVDNTMVEWCAFFADVDHAINEVKSGVRVTAAYILRRKDRAPASADLPREIQAEEQSSIVRGKFDSASRNEDFLKNGGKVGFACVHEYTNNEVFPEGKDSYTQLGPSQIRKLKGRDLIVAEAAAAVGFDVYLVPYLQLDEDVSGDLGDR